MKFVVSSTALSSHLQAVGRVINSKNTLPILDCFLFNLKNNLLTITASDNETTMETSFEVTHSEGDILFAVSARTLLESLKELPEQPLSFDINETTLEIVLGFQNGKYNFMAINGDEFPQFPAENENATTITIDAGVLLTGINRSIFACGDDELRPVMNGIFFDITEEDITLVASDGHKLVRNKTMLAKGTENASFIFPRKPANLMKSILPKEQGEVLISFNNKNATFTLSNYKLVCRLIEGKYPNYNSVIPKGNPYKITIDRLMLLSALKRVSVFSNQSVSLVKLQLEGNQMTVSTQDIDFSTSADEKIACQFDGEPMSIGFKATFLIEMLSNMMGTTEVIIELIDPSRAGILVPAEQQPNEDLLMLLMPLILND